MSLLFQSISVLLSNTLAYPLSWYRQDSHNTSYQVSRGTSSFINVSSWVLYVKAHNAGANRTGLSAITGVLHFKGWCIWLFYLSHLVGRRGAESLMTCSSTLFMVQNLNLETWKEACRYEHGKSDIKKI